LTVKGKRAVAFIKTHFKLDTIAPKKADPTSSVQV
jgi:hypothetical protein